MLKRYILDHKGIAMLLVLSVLIMVALIGNVVITLISSQGRLTHHQISRIRAFYAAQAAMNLAFEKLRTGAWSTGSTHTLCASGCSENDPEIPYQVNITIGLPGSGIPGTSKVKITTTYTYKP